MAAALALLASPGQAQFACADTTAALERLRISYGERIAHRALDANGNVILVMMSKEGKTWSILSLTPHGVACLLSAGEWWQTIKSGKRL